MDTSPAEPIPITSPGHLGAVVRRLRQQHDLTQQHLADRAHVSRRWVGELERGKPRAEMARVLAVVEALGMAVMLAPAVERPDPLATLRDPEDW